ncbi:barstar family protein [Streptomyces sp. JH34]|uniref:barstar family protein n=1 Tax=unclassified Streptomyces TaxID=2593676 RepID=UPI003211E42E
MTDSEPVVEPRGRLIKTLDDFWDAVSEPCGLPEWFGRNLDAGRTRSRPGASLG